MSLFSYLEAASRPGVDVLGYDFGIARTNANSDLFASEGPLRVVNLQGTLKRQEGPLWETK